MYSNYPENVLLASSCQILRMQKLLSVRAAALPVPARARVHFVTVTKIRVTESSSLTANLKGFVLLRCLGQKWVYGFS